MPETATYKEESFAGVFLWISPAISLHKKWSYPLRNSSVNAWYQFVIFNSWKVPWNWIVLVKIVLFHLVWWETKLEALQTRPIFQILSFLRNNSLAVAKLQTDVVLNTPLNHETSQLTFTCSNSTTETFEKGVK